MNRLKPWLRWLFSLAVLAALLAWLQPAIVVEQIIAIEIGWLLVALLVSVAQILLSAWRWRFTARQLELPLGWRPAVSEYYLAGFINQVLPGGVIGDAWRAHRHARASDTTGPAWRAVIIERTSGQLVVAVGALAIILFTPTWRAALAGIWTSIGPIPVIIVAAAVFVFALLLTWRLLSRHRPGLIQVMRKDIMRALLSPRVLPVQLLLSLLIVFSYMLVFALTARGIGIELPFGWLLAVGLPILLAMLIPLTVAGWGLREATAAAVWMAMGLPAEQGVAVAMAYGVVIFLASLPGIVTFWIPEP
jgi:glycosyltransferase 2 family protein